MTSVGVKQVWVTRAPPGADATAARARALGFDPLVCPVLRAEEVSAPLELGTADVLAFTSARAAEIAGRRLDRRPPVFAVGAATAAAARAAGFSEVVSAEGDVRDLEALLLRRAEGRRVVHVAGEAVAGDLVGALRREGRDADRVVVYRTAAVQALPHPVSRALKARSLRAVLIHSPKAAAVLARLLDRDPSVPRDGLTVVALSEACARPLEGFSDAVVLVAAQPTEAALLDRLAGLAPG